MFADLENDVKKIFLAGLGAVALTAEKAEDLVKDLVKRGELTMEQGKALNDELKHKIKETVEDKKAEFCSTVDVERMSPEEREDLKRRLAALDAKETDGNSTVAE